jgi:mono/diheme cytochrome c family protein
MTLIGSRIALLACLQLVIGTSALVAGGARPVDFAAQVQPLLAAHCVKCHGPKESQSGLRLDRFALIRKGGDRGTAVIPGKAAKSVLFQALLGQGDLTPMPAEAPRLPKDKIALIARWIDEGAKGPANVPAEAEAKKHWAFEPIRRPSVPRIPNGIANGIPNGIPNGEPLDNPIDAFIRARLATEHLAPSPEADRSTLIRRLSLDLRGLPPRPDEVEDFRRDTAPGAYERLVERMLASPAYGERWGRHWLDQARYADSNGFTIDSPRSIWKYRDWVISAINDDLPFDQFAIQQLAGDLLPGATPEEIVATGFHRNTLVNEEGGTDKEQFRVEAVMDRVNTTGAVFLGLTVGCAQCHHHKFDPISQRDYYNLFAIFNNCDEPTYAVATAAQARRLSQLDRQIAEAEKPLAAHDRRLMASLPAWEKQIAARPPVRWTLLDPAAVRTEKGAVLNPLADRSLVVDFSVPANDTYHIQADVPQDEITAIRLEALTHMSLPLMGPGRSDAAGNFVLSEFELRARPLKEAASNATGWKPVKLAAAVADHAQEGFPAADAIDGNPATGWSIGTKVGSPHVDRELVVFPAEPIRNPGGTRLEVILRQDHTEPNFLIGRLRLSAASGPADALKLPNSIRDLALVPRAKRTKAQRTELAAAFRETDRDRAPFAARVAALKSRKNAIEQTVPTTLVMQEESRPRESHIMIRGDFLRTGARVTGGVPAFLPPLPEKTEHPTRLDLARWLFDPANPLTARVTVNRMWQHFFGAGLVDTENDFGMQGSLPTHPELLDWLSAELVLRGWSRKSLHRLIVTSATYRQNSLMRDELREHDPNNRLLARQSRLRLEAEIVRDAALAASGLLSGKIGGPSVFPPQPEGIFVVTQQKKAWPESKGADRYRRGMYIHFWRSSPYPMLPTFDVPEGNTTCTRRARSNTPLQALTLANDRVFVEIAEALAARILRDPATDVHSRLRRAFMVCLSREPTPAEETRLAEFIATQANKPPSNKPAPPPRGASCQLARFNPTSGLSGQASSSPHELAAWTAGARVLLNVDEFITRE